MAFAADMQLFLVLTMNSATSYIDKTDKNATVCTDKMALLFIEEFWRFRNSYKHMCDEHKHNRLTSRAVIVSYLV